MSDEFTRHQVEVDVVEDETEQEGPGDNLDGLLPRATFHFGCDNHQARSSDGQLMRRSHWMVADRDLNLARQAQDGGLSKKVRIEREQRYSEHGNN